MYLRAEYKKVTAGRGHVGGEDDGKQGHEELLWLTPEAHHEVADGNEHQRVQNVTWYLKFRNKCYHSNI